MTALEMLGSARPDAVQRPEYRALRAQILLSMGRGPDALSDLVEYDSGDVPTRFLVLRAEVEERLGQIDAARRTLTRALQAGPDGTLLGRRATLHQALGAFDAARADLRAAISLRPTDGDLYRLLAGLHRFTPDDPLIVEIRARLAALPEQSPERIGFGFALAKALDDCGDYDGAFAALRRANAAMRARFPYDIRARTATLEAYSRSFADFDPASHASPDATQYAPIFVSGMPRSGTTLVEQILSSHAHVQAGGEVARFLPRMVETIGDPATGLLDLMPRRFGLLGQRYHADMLERLHIAKRHTDKSIQTVLYAGPLLAALPRARIIHVTRDPNAVALSLFRQVFRPGKQLFSYDLADIRAYQASFARGAAFWADRLPGSILTVAYEDLVSDPEPVIRRMLAFAGLDWDPACLSAESNPRPVQTLSAAAVRQRIGTEARDHWRNYATHLGAA